MSMINEKSAESALLDIEESEVLKTVESVTENDELFRIDEDCEANISEIFSETITKIQSAERGLKRKYEKLQEMKDQVLEGGKELEAKIQAFDDEKTKMKKINKNVESVVTVNVGGMHHVTSRSTLCADKNSMLTAMFSGIHKLETLKDGSYFIDADGTHFRIILNYLRGRIVYSDDLPSDKETLVELRREADFYNLLDLKDMINVSLKTSSRNVEEWFCFYFEELNHVPVSYQSKNNVVFRKVNASNGNFKNVNFLHEADFERANLTSAKFHYCKFYKDTSFKGACLENAEFHSCEFANNAKITFDEADLCKCKFTCDNLSLAFKRTTSMISFAKYIEKMSFCNVKNIEQAHFMQGKLELIQKKL